MNAEALVRHSEVPAPLVRLSELARGSLRSYLHGLAVEDDGSVALQLWQRLLQTASSPGVKEKYLTSVSNVLCVFMECATTSPSVEVRKLSFSTLAWFDAFDVAHRAFRDGKTKPAIQVLETLTKLVERNPDHDIKHSILNSAVLSTLKILLISTQPNEVKESCIFLTCFIKAGLSLETLQALVVETSKTNHHLWLKKLKQNKIQVGKVEQSTSGLYDLFLALVVAARLTEPQSAAIKLLSRLCNHGSLSGSGPWPTVVVSQVIRHVMASDESAVEDFAQTIFPVLLNDKGMYESFLHDFSQAHSSKNDVVALLATVRVGRLKDYMTDQDLPTLFNRIFPLDDVLNSEQTPYGSLQSGLSHGSAEVRIRTLELLCSSSQTSAPVSDAVLGCITLGLPYLFDDTDPYDRGEILSILKRFFKRIENSLFVEEKKGQNHVSGKENRQLFASYSNFGNGVLVFLKGELAPQCSYQRHILALNTLELALDLPISSRSLRISASQDPALVRGLVSLVMDAFDDVRDTSTRLLLRLSYRDGACLLKVFETTQTLNKALELSAATNRADQADAAGRLSAINQALLLSQRPDAGLSPFFTFESVLHTLNDYLGKNSYPNPADGFPLHAILLTLAHVLPHLPTTALSLGMDLSSQTVDICVGVWHTMRSQLCIDSPETAQDISEESTIRGPKDLLAYSWRALKDSSFVLQKLLVCERYTFEILQHIGDLCMEQLTQLRHRGAFSTVAQTFILCCQCCRNQANAQADGMLETWYNTALAQIDEQSGRLTRRSAGLPAMLTALLEPSNSSSMSKVVRELSHIAAVPIEMENNAREQQGQRLPQVHALNCLKEFMTHSRFRIASGQHFNQIIQLASRSLKSSIWTVRNCGLMLLRACINRLDTVTISKPSEETLAEVLRIKVETPFSIAVKLLCDEERGISLETLSEPVDESSITVSSAPEHVFAGLELLGRMHHRAETPKFVDSLIIRQFENDVWAIREQAALLLTERVEHGDEVQTLTLLLSHLENHSDNALHGRLLCARYILTATRLSGDTTTLFKVLSWLNQAFPHICAGLANRSPILRAVAIDIQNDQLRTLYRNTDDKTLDWISKLKQTSVFSPYHGDVFPYRRALVLAQIFQRVYTIGNTVMLSQTNTDEIAGICTDEDIIRDLAEELENDLMPLQPAILLLLTFFDKSNSDISLAQIMVSLSICLEHWADTLSKDQITQVEKRLSVIGPRSRELRIGQTRLRANLIRQLLRHSETSGVRPGLCDSPPVECVVQYAKDLYLAAHDEVDLPTRENAVHSLALIAPFLSSTPAAFPSRVKISLCVTLYHFLNDDDEEIRSSAAHAACSVLQSSTSSGMIPARSFCPLRAREELVKHLCTKYHGVTFANAALVEVVGWYIPGQKDGVGMKIKAIRDAATNLFMEEKQNLYIDEVREALSWSVAATEILVRHLPDRSWLALQSWVNEGIETLLKELESFVHGVETKAEIQLNRRARVYGPFGPTYHPDVLIVFVRVILAAELLLAHYYSAAPRELEIAHDLERQLHLLHDLSLRSQAHEVVTKTLDDTLNGRRRGRN